MATEVGDSVSFAADTKTEAPAKRLVRQQTGLGTTATEVGDSVSFAADTKTEAPAKRLVRQQTGLGATLPVENESARVRSFEENEQDPPSSQPAATGAFERNPYCAHPTGLQVGQFESCMASKSLILF